MIDYFMDSAPALKSKLQYEQNIIIPSVVRFLFNDSCLNPIDTISTLELIIHSQILISISDIYLGTHMTISELTYSVRNSQVIRNPRSLRNSHILLENLALTMRHGYSIHNLVGES